MYYYSNKFNPSLSEAIQEATKNGLTILDGQQVIDGWLLWDEKTTVMNLDLTAKFSCSSDSRGAGIVVSSYGKKKKRYPYKYDLNDEENRIQAVLQFAKSIHPEYHWIVSVYSSIPGAKEDLLLLVGIRNDD